VSKTWPAADVALLTGLPGGPRDLGESRDQEARPKALAFPSLRWHFLGRLQRNKARSVASYAAVVHSLDRADLVGPLARGAAEAGRELRVLVQVTLDGDPARGGVLPAAVPGLADAAEQGGLRVAGVMAVAPAGVPPGPAFARLADASAALVAAHPGAGWISAGMSGDLEAAVAHGATHVRVGTALFGGRAARGH